MRGLEPAKSSLRPYQAGWWVQRLILGYRFVLSPVLGRRCRFEPTCSAYAYAAVDEWGALRGGWMALRRIGRCHPWNDGGYDPVRRRRPQEHADARESAR
jgi:uncharacterized protein